MPTKFGLSQVNNEAPIIYKRIESAVIAVIIPAFSALIMSMNITAEKQTQYIAISVFVGAIVKAVGVMLGTTPDTPTPPSNTTNTQNTGK